MNRPSKTINTTREYYEQNAQEYFDSTFHLNMEHIYKPFLELVPKHGRVLDAGCGSGRDSLYFRQHGYSVIAIDNSSELVKLASFVLGENCFLMSFDQIEYKNEFDGIWACASLLHIPKSDMDTALPHLTEALKINGVLYASFKYGNEQTIRKGRLFNCYDEESFGLLLKNHPALRMLTSWKTEDVRNNRKGELWLNVLLKKEVPIKE
jgi:2-polyprenyl-3-methyl-5-hydroxy-6-metoxy-1,4-benzoquinol methylase